MEEKNTNISLETPSRQSPIAIFLIVQSLLRQMIRQFWPILLVFILNYFNFQARDNTAQSDPYFTKVIFLIAGLSTIGSIIAYFKFYYYVKDNEFIIEKGLFKKTKINIPFDRIQTINFEQNLIHQAFNVVRLEIDSAGTNQKEISLQAIRRDRAEAIRAFIMREKAKLSPIETANALENVQLKEQKADLLLHLNPLDLLKVGVSQNHLRGLGIIIGFGFWIFQSLDSLLPDYRQGDNPIEYLEKDLGLGAIFSFWAYLIFALIIFSVIISLTLTVFQHFDLRFFRMQNGFKVVSGLFTKREASANINKIQFISWENSILKRLFGIFRLHLFQASSAAVSLRQSINVPGCYKEQIDQVRATYFPDEHQYTYKAHSISRLIIGRRVLYLGGIPAAIILFWAWMQANPILPVWAIVWILFVFITSKVFHEKWKIFIHEEGILTQSGIFSTKFTLLKWYKIQAINTRQSIYQRRKDVADLYFYTAAGSVKIPYLPLEMAKAISNYALYKVETDERDWM